MSSSFPKSSISQSASLRLSLVPVLQSIVIRNRVQVLGQVHRLNFPVLEPALMQAFMYMRFFMSISRYGVLAG